MIEIILDKVYVERSKEYVVNDYFKIINNHGNAIILAKELRSDEFTCKSTHSILLHSLDLALPKKILSTSCNYEIYKRTWKNRVLFSYYGNRQYSDLTITTIDDLQFEKILRYHILLVNHNVSLSENINLRYTPWNVAYNEYLAAVDVGIVEQGIMHLITALEAMLVDSQSEVSFRVGLYTSILMGKNYDERNSIQEIIKSSYNIRSKVVHGDIKALKKELKRTALFETMFELKRLVSDILLLTYGIEKSTLVNKINHALLDGLEINF